MGTIVQEYGPIYGEAVNGTVSGRPNGSVFVPLSNTIEIYNIRSLTGFSYSSGSKHYKAYLKVSAQAQDLASYMSQEVYSDSALTTMIAQSFIPAAMFQTEGYVFSNGIASATPPSVGDTCYFVARLMSSGGVPVATSTVLALDCDQVT